MVNKEASKVCFRNVPLTFIVNWEIEQKLLKWPRFRRDIAVKVEEEEINDMKEMFRIKMLKWFTIKQKLKDIVIDDEGYQICWRAIEAKDKRLKIWRKMNLKAHIYQQEEL